MTRFTDSGAGKQRVAFYGGSFDPPHRGHLTIARAARQALELDRVLFAPVGTQPLKPWGGTASFADRVAMTQLAIAEEPGFEISLADAPHSSQKPNYTIDTLLGLQRGLPAAELFCLMGADSLEKLGSWHRAAELPFVATLVVAGRPGVELSRLASLLPSGLLVSAEPTFAGLQQGVELVRYPLQNQHGEQAQLILLPALADPTSATQLRELLQENVNAAADLLPASVLDYIRSHQLYK